MKKFQPDQLIQVARDVCNEIEKFNAHETSRLLSVLIKLLQNANALEEASVQVCDDDLCIPKNDVPNLANIPEDMFFYGVFSPLDATSICKISFKDSLKDIYESLKGGLLILNQDPTKKFSVLWEWKTEFQFHWGRHLVDVIRFLVLCKDMDFSERGIRPC